MKNKVINFKNIFFKTFISSIFFISVSLSVYFVGEKAINDFKEFAKTTTNEKRILTKNEMKQQIQNLTTNITPLQNCLNINQITQLNLIKKTILYEKSKIQSQTINNLIDDLEKKINEIKATPSNIINNINPDLLLNIAPTFTHIDFTKEPLAKKIIEIDLLKSKLKKIIDNLKYIFDIDTKNHQVIFPAISSNFFVTATQAQIEEFKNTFEENINNYLPISLNKINEFIIDAEQFPKIKKDFELLKEKIINYNSIVLSNKMIYKLILEEIENIILKKTIATSQINFSKPTTTENSTINELFLSYEASLINYNELFDLKEAAINSINSSISKINNLLANCENG